MAAKPKKLKIHELAILNWLCTHDGPGRMRFLINDHDSGLRFYETTEMAGDKYVVKEVLNTGFGGGVKDSELFKSLLMPNASPDIHPLYERGAINYHNQLYNGPSFSAFFKKIDNLEERAGYRASVVRLTKSGHEYWKNEGRELFEKMKADREAEIAKVSRYVLVGRKIKREFTIDKDRLPEGLNLKLPVYTREFTDPGLLVRVTKETDSRYYVDDVIDVARETSSFGDGFRTVSYGSHVSGSGTRKYISKSDVIMDPATQEDVDRIKQINDEYSEDLERLAEQSLAEIEQIIKTMSDRVIQKQAEHDDMMREALEGGQTSAPKP